MSAHSSQIPVVACVPDAIDPAERAAHFERARRLLSSCAEGRQALPDGLQFRLPPELLEAVAKFVANERKCCPFMTFEIKVEPNGGAVTLSMTGPAGTREVVEAELGLHGQGGCR